MSDYTQILQMLDSIQQQVDVIKDELGRLQAQALELIPTTLAPVVIPPTVPDVEIMGGAKTEQFPDCCAVGDDQRYSVDTS